ncbi:phosphonate ABC transporter ATP-binding protein [Polymorphum gilvum]|uniref:Phosphonates ABC transporter, ATP-binding protein n=1 Tax=Polymorphum gilvum (strain LMG 25793 / CGMCC 1.9160 / SL003B-26A1) TaxID=991905 RepID=F2J604_POLGS|nr:ATP-binding cassette domain-containing protein [Polymorphum gilvum]ADZ71258.1 Phosphonates ABC transporter, ATP-binding protein [Polymorphum gilvum SL003B-26A1]
MTDLVETSVGARFTEDGGRASAAAMPEPLLALRGVRKSYGRDLMVLKGIDVAIRPGEAVALIGANGSGKSTLLKSLIGLHDIDDGTITLFDQTFSTRPSGRQKRAIRRRVGFVFQAHSLVRRQSVLTNVIHGQFGLPGVWRAWHQAVASQDMRRQAAAALDAVGLLDKAFARADQLSGGQQQRVAIARALVRRPPLMIADEPAASLDPSAGHEVMRQLVDLSRTQGATLVFTSHDMEHAVSYAERIVALKDGRVFIDAPARDLSMREIEKVFQ